MLKHLAHRGALLELLQFERPFPELRSSILAFPYDYDGDPVVLTRNHLAHVLQCVVDGTISEQELEAWSELIEGRPGIEYESGMESRLSEILFQLSTPEINEPVTVEKCWRLLKDLR
ncbi:MAG TPA: hypothetical protein VF226_22215 [Hyphomicrobiaceae bacterium]